MKKKVLGISIGVVVVIAAIVGIAVFQKQAAEKKKIEAAQSEVTAIEKEAAEDGDLYKETTGLYDENEDFLAKDIDMKILGEIMVEISTKEAAIKVLEKEYSSKIETDAAKSNLKKLQEKVLLANDKLAVQSNVNQFFDSKETAIDGDSVEKTLPIVMGLTKESISEVTEIIEDNEALEGEWQEAIVAVLKNAKSQVDQVGKVDKLLKEAFDGNVPKETVKQSEYDALNKEVEKVKNEELKITYKAKLVLMKAVIDTQAQLDELTKKQKEAGEKAEKAVADAASAAQKAVEDAAAAAAQKVSEAEDILAGYSDDQIEYARVWLAKFGTKPSELNVTIYPAGTPINPYNESSVAYPTTTISLSGVYNVDGSIVYTSNHDGTVTVYEVPGHWPAASAADPAVSMELSQRVLDTGQVMSVPAGNPADVRDVILLIR